LRSGQERKSVIERNNLPFITLKDILSTWISPTGGQHWKYTLNQQPTNPRKSMSRLINYSTDTKEFPNAANHYSAYRAALSANKTRDPRSVLEKGNLEQAEHHLAIAKWNAEEAKKEIAAVAQSNRGSK
jgi:hypothetical protein